MAFAPDLDPDVARVVRRVVDEVAPLRIILFGSRANGTAGPDSDIDLLIVVPDGNRPLTVMHHLREQIGWPGVEVDYIVVTPDRLERYGTSIGFIYREALLHGIDAYTADPVYV